MKVRIIEQPSRYSSDEVTWNVQVWRWYWPFWVTVEDHLPRSIATSYARTLAQPTIEEVK
jgi:hypothetical protein